MRIFRSIATATLAAALAVSVPVTSASAATRANAAVPSAPAVRGASSVTVVSDTWALWLIAALSAALVVRIATDDVDGPGIIRTISRG